MVRSLTFEARANHNVKELLNLDGTKLVRNAARLPKGMRLLSYYMAIEKGAAIEMATKIPDNVAQKMIELGQTMKLPHIDEKLVAHGFKNHFPYEKMAHLIETLGFATHLRTIEVIVKDKRTNKVAIIPVVFTKEPHIVPGKELTIIAAGRVWEVKAIGFYALEESVKGKDLNEEQMRRVEVLGKVKIKLKKHEDKT
jgi:hypothetical protein